VILGVADLNGGAMKYVIIGILCSGLSTAAYSDEVLLTNGHILLGIAREERGQVIVEMTFGTVRISRAEVQSIVPGRSLLQEYEERALSLSSCPEADSTFRLALWARSHGLTRHVTELLRRTVALDPEHLQARTMLGEVWYQGKWRKGLDLKKTLGWVEVGGMWVAPSESDAFCAPEAIACGVVQAERKAIPLRRKHAPPEGVPYSFGLPGYHSNGTHNFGSGGYSLWGGLVPIHNLLDLPVIRSRPR